MRTLPLEMRKRRKARELALEALYRTEITNDEYESILADIFARTHSLKEIVNFTRELVSRTIKEQKVIDEIISKTVENWEIDRIAVIDKNILRMAICELLYFTDVPFKVSINEAVELAKKYSTSESGRFINGVVDRVAKMIGRLED